MNDRFDNIDRTMERLDRDMRELRGEMRQGFADVRGEIDALRQLIYRMGGGLFVAVLASVFLGGF